ncbi:MAG: helix-turn-helix domain-containing protein [Rhizobiales bacterium]|nr:helix-turn-helix domain-containing protein [Hyphomicrobiales bacterium]
MSKSPRKAAVAHSLATEKRKNADKNQRNSVQSLAKGFRVLESFSRGAEEMTLTEIADASDLDPGTTFRMLNTLVALGYVARVPDSKRFALTLKVLDLGFHAIGRQDLRAMVRPTLRSLVDEVSEAASFGVLEGGDVLYIERVRAGFARLGVDIRIGTRIPASITVIGQAILAFLPEEKLRPVLETRPAQEGLIVPPVTRARLLPKLERIRADGFVLGESAISAGLCVLAMPVLDHDGIALGAISIAAPTVRTSADELRKRALDPLRIAARNAARALEASGGTASS